MVWYRHLDCVMFSDTMFASARVGKSVRNFTCYQVFLVTDFGWSIAFNMEFERDIHFPTRNYLKRLGSH